MNEDAAGAVAPADRMPSFLLPSASPAELAALRPGTRLRLRRAARHGLLIEVETLDGRCLGRLPGEDALRLAACGRDARAASVTGLVPGRGRARLMMSLELAAA